MARSAVQHAPAVSDADPDLVAVDGRRNVIGYVRVVVAARFALPAKGEERVRYQELEVDEILPLLAPTDWERGRLRDFVKKEASRPAPHVVVEWLVQRRFMPLESVAGEDERGSRVLASLAKEWAEEQERRV